MGCCYLYGNLGKNYTGRNKGKELEFMDKKYCKNFCHSYNQPCVYYRLSSYCRFETCITKCAYGKARVMIEDEDGDVQGVKNGAIYNVLDIKSDDGDIIYSVKNEEGKTVEVMDMFARTVE